MEHDLKWLHRQNRMARCKKHGLHYDPKVARGCILCLKEAPRRVSKPKFLLLLLAILGLSFALFQIFGKKPPPADDGLGIRGLPVSASSGIERIDPEAHRVSILAFEDTLFDRNPSGPSRTRDRLDATGQTLQQEVSRQGKEAIAEFRDDMEGFLELVRAQPVDPARQVQLQKAWTQIRNRHFAEAAWLARAETGAAESQTGASRYRSAGADLESLLRDALADVEPLAGTDDADAWKSFTNRFGGRLESLIDEKPARPRANADAQLLLGYQSFEKALRGARALARRGNPPGDTRQVASALEAAENARRAFEKARE